MADISLNQRLEDRVTGIISRIYETDENVVSEHAVIIMSELIRTAARYWDGFDADDFCVQHVSPDGIVFGSVNRLIWTPKTGFYPDAQDCNPMFLACAQRLGPVPQPRAVR
jgi:hypothetical protein